MSTLTTRSRRCERCDWEFVTEDLSKRFCSARCEEGGGMTPLVWTPSRVVSLAAEAFGVTEKELLSHDRSVPLIHYRMVTYAAVRRFCGFSYPSVARYFGREGDRRWVYSQIKRVESDPHLSELYSRLAERLLVEGVS